jgi:hypothetical protein
MRAMNVRRLIEALSALDPDLPVIMPSRLAEFCFVDQVILDVAVITDQWGLAVCDYEDDGCFTVARLYEEADGDHPDKRPKPPTN